MISLPGEETQKSLFGLLCTGIVEFSSIVKRAPGRDGRGGPAGRDAEPRKASPTAPPPSVAQPVAAAAPAPPQPTPAVLPRADPAAEARRQEILETHAGLKTKTHFEILAIPRASTEVQVKEAYFRLAKRFHPDAHHDPSLSDLRDRLEAIFIRLGEAYETLRNPRTRATYEERLGASGRAGTAGTADPAAAPAPAADPEALVRAAEAQVRQADRLFENEKYWDAIQALEPAVMVVTGKMRQRARILLSRAYLKNPKWVKRAEETLLATIHDDAQNVDGHFLLGRIYKERGLKTRANHMFRKVLEIKPDHEEAAAELIDEEPEVKPESGGFIKKIFGKKP
jgi:tetratricopeptide (TPR) repeat protein